MNRFRFFGLLMMISLVLAGCSQQTSNPATQTGGNKQWTAREAFKIAQPEAQKWASDSYLVNFSTVRVQTDGQARAWFALFYSPDKKTNYKVNVEEGKITVTSEADKKKSKEIKGNWIDSTAAAKSAIPQCGETTKDEYFFDLESDRVDETATWTVQCTVGENKTLSVDLNAATGEYIKTRKAGIGW